MTWTLRLPGTPPSGNLLKRMHWAEYKRLLERWFLIVRCAPGFVRIPPASGRRRLVITRRGARALDRDNLWASMKPVIDVLRPAKWETGTYRSGAKKGLRWSRARIGHGLIQEDDAAHLELEVRQEPLPKGEAPHLVLVLEDLTP